MHADQQNGQETRYDTDTEAEVERERLEQRLAELQDHLAASEAEKSRVNEQLTQAHLEAKAAKESGQQELERLALKVENVETRSELEMYHAARRPWSRLHTNFECHTAINSLQ